MKNVSFPEIQWALKLPVNFAFLCGTTTVVLPALVDKIYVLLSILSNIHFSE